MNEIEKILSKKEAWGPGPWQDEPDRWEGRFLDLVLLARRGPMGAWCGYVGVPPSHPWFGKHYSECLKKNCKKRKQTQKQLVNKYRRIRERASSRREREFAQLMIRSMQSSLGQIAAASRSSCNHWRSRPESFLNVHGGLTYSDACDGEICHQPQVGEPEHVWWFGFDCAHSMDLIPQMQALSRALPGYPGGLHDKDSYRNLAYVQAEILSLARQLDMVAQVWGKGISPALEQNLQALLEGSQERADAVTDR